MKKKIILINVCLIYCSIFFGCQNTSSTIDSADETTPTEIIMPTIQPTNALEAADTSAESNWKCIYMGTKVVDTYSKIENQLKFDNEADWLTYSYENLPSSIVDVVDQEIDWDTKGVVVLQGLSAKGYFTFIPPISDISMDSGVLNISFVKNTDTTKTFYVISDDMNDIIKDIYMILLDKSIIEKLNDNFLIIYNNLKRLSVCSEPPRLYKKQPHVVYYNKDSLIT